MRKENLFYLILVITILITRISILLVPEVEIKFWSLVIHHFWFGVIFMMFGIIIPKRKSYSKLLLYGIGTGFIIDQLTFMLLGAGKDQEYWALPSLLGTIIIALVIYPVREKTVNFFLQKSLN